MLFLTCIAMLAVLAATAWWACAQYDGQLHMLWMKTGAAERTAGTESWEHVAHAPVSPMRSETTSTAL